VAAQQRSTTVSAGPRSRLAEPKPVGDWAIGFGSLIAIVLAVAIGNAATITAGKNPLAPDRLPAHTVSVPSKTDDYVEGLAKLGIATLACAAATPKARSLTCSR
jgi:hypothetical protein